MYTKDWTDTVLLLALAKHKSVIAKDMHDSVKVKLPHSLSTGLSKGVNRGSSLDWTTSSQQERH